MKGLNTHSDKSKQPALEIQSQLGELLITVEIVIALLLCLGCNETKNSSRTQ